MININKIRAQIGSDDIVDHIELHANLKPILTALLDSLETAESECLEEARLNGMGSEREAALMAKLEAAEKEREMDEARIADLMAELNRVGHENDGLRAKIEQMERQEPVRHEFKGRDGVWYPFIDQRHHENTVADGSWPIRALYALPGAQPAPSGSEERMRWLLRQIVSALPSRRDWLDPAIEEEAMLAAAPEDKS